MFAPVVSCFAQGSAFGSSPSLTAPPPIPSTGVSEVVVEQEDGSGTLDDVRAEAQAVAACLVS